MPMDPRLLRPRASGFSPKSIAGLALWLDMSNESSVTLNAGNVSQVDDLSGNNLHAKQPTEVLQPAYSNTINNKKVVSTSDSPATALFVENPVTSNDGISVFAVIKRTGSTPRHLSFNTTVDTESFGAGQDGWIPMYGAVSGLFSGYADGSIKSQGTLVVGETGVFSLFNDGSQLFNFKNGVALAVENITALSNSFSRLFISGRNGAGAAAASQDVGEIILFTRITSDSERQQIEKYLGTKWGIAIS